MMIGNHLGYITKLKKEITNPLRRFDKIVKARKHIKVNMVSHFTWE